MSDNLSFKEATALFAKYQITLGEEQYELLSKFAELLHDELSRQNISAVRTIPEMWTRHFLDSAFLLSYIRQDATVIDIGTGGGIPGIPLAIFGRQCVLLDSELRKIEFCQRVINTLDLSAKAISARAEELAADSDYREHFDFVVSRAMANGSMLCELALPFVRVGGSLIAMKGRAYSEEEERFTSAVPKLGGTLREPVPYTLEGEKKYLIIAEKTSSTSAQFPRRFAKIKRQPL